MALRFLWPFDLCYSGHVSCILLPRGPVHLTFLLLHHHVVYCAQFLHVYRAIRQYLCIHDQRSRSIDWWYIHDSKFDMPYYGYEVKSCAWLCTCIYIPCSTFQLLFQKSSNEFIDARFFLLQLLNTFSNFGGTWPKFFVLEAVDKFTVTTCSIPNADGSEMVCMTEAAKVACQKVGGTCIIQQDGYYYAGSLCVLLGITLLVTFVKPAILKIQTIPKHMWRLKAAEDEKSSL